MKIAILGCGWLGMELGKRLRKKNHEVRGSVTRIEKLQEVRSAGMVPYSIKLYEKGIQGDIRSFLSGVNILIVDIPPGLRANPESNFVKKIKKLIPHIEKSYLQKVIFTSSTSVYKDDEDFPVYTEGSETKTSGNKAEQLKKVEQLFLKNEKFNASILRFGGLIGSERHPIKHLSGRTDVKNPEAPINLVHQEDCINAVCKVLENEKDNSIWNVVYPDHPKKEAYYLKAAKDRDLAAPEFDYSQKSKGKRISSEKLQKGLKFEFTQPIW